jgi:two-component system phosphate regulon response regulator PhoB
MSNSTGNSVLIIGDDVRVSNLIRDTLAIDGLAASQVFTADAALRHVEQETPALVVIDLHLPGIDGWELCRQLRRHPRAECIPIVFLSAEVSEADKVAGLELGADDYVSKPFSPRELRARVRALLRRARWHKNAEQVLSRGPLHIDLSKCAVRYDGNDVSLTPTEFRIMALLASCAGRVVSREQIVVTVHGGAAGSNQRAIDAHIKSIRRKLVTGGDQIETVRGFGYRLREAA